MDITKLSDPILYPDSELVKLANLKSLSNEERNAVQLEFESRVNAKNQAKEAKILQEAHNLEIAREQERVRLAEREKWLKTPEGIEWLKTERIRTEQEERKKEERTKLEQLQKETQEAQEKQDQLREYKRLQEIRNNYDPEEQQEIFAHEQATGQKFYAAPEVLKGPEKHLKLLPFIDDKNSKEYLAAYQCFKRFVQKDDPSDIESAFITAFKNKFRNPENTNNNSLSNTTNNAILQAGTNEHDKSIVQLQSAIELFKIASKKEDKAHEKLMEINGFLLEMLKSGQEHIRILEKQNIKKETKLEELRVEKGEEELKLLKYKKKWQKKHPWVAGLEGASKGIETLADSIKYALSSDEDKKKIDSEKLQRKIEKKSQESLVFQHEVDKAAGARISAEFEAKISAEVDRRLAELLKQNNTVSKEDVSK